MDKPFLTNKKKNTTPLFADLFYGLPSPKPVMIPYFHGQLPVPPDGGFQTVQDPSQITIPSELRRGNSDFSQTSSEVRWWIQIGF